MLGLGQVKFDYEAFLEDRTKLCEKQGYGFFWAYLLVVATLGGFVLVVSLVHVDPSETDSSGVPHPCVHCNRAPPPPPPPPHA